MAATNSATASRSEATTAKTPRKRKPKTDDPQIVVRGAREHNLKNVNVELPRDKLVVFTGLSGFGQVEPRVRHDLRRGAASLRRVAELLRPTVPRADGQARRRRHRGAVAGDLDRPEVGAAATRAPRSARSPRSTTTCACCTPASACSTARTTAPSCNARRRSRSSIASSTSTRASASRCSLRSCAAARASTTPCSRTCPARATCAPASTARPSTSTSSSSATSGSRSTRTTRSRSSSTASCSRRASSAASPTRSRQALGLADGVAEIEVVPREGEGAPETLTFSQHLACPVCGKSYDEPAPRNFSFNSPYGACATCDGLGTTFEVDPELVIPDPEMSLLDGAIAPWRICAHPVLHPDARVGRRGATTSTSTRRGSSSPPSSRRSSCTASRAR